MDWVMNHFDAIFLIAIVLLAFVQKFLRARGTGDGRSPNTDQEQAERTRRIQEEIRRRILERRGLAGGSPAETGMSEPAPETPVSPPIIETWRRMPMNPADGESQETAAAADVAANLEHQHQMLRKWESMNQTPGIEMGTSAILLEAAPVLREDSGLRAELRSRDGLRRVVVLREILGPPLGLR